MILPKKIAAMTATAVGVAFLLAMPVSVQVAQADPPKAASDNADKNSPPPRKHTFHTHSKKHAKEHAKNKKAAHKVAHQPPAPPAPPK